MKQEIIQDIEKASSNVKLDIDDIKSYAYNWNLFGAIEIKNS